MIDNQNKFMNGIFLYGIILLFYLVSFPQTTQAYIFENNCRKPIGFVYSDGKGNRTTKGLGGNSLRIFASEIRRLGMRYEGKNLNYALAFGQGGGRKKHKGTIKYLTLHTRYSNGAWKIIYKGKLRDFGTEMLTTKFLKDKRITHIIVSVNGAHEKFEPIVGKVAVRFCFSGGMGRKKVNKVTQKDINSILGYWGRGWDTHSKHYGGNCNDQYSGSIGWTTNKGRQVLNFKSDYFGSSVLSFKGASMLIAKDRKVVGLINRRRDIITWYNMGKPTNAKNIAMIWWKGCH